MAKARRPRRALAAALRLAEVERSEQRLAKLRAGCDASSCPRQKRHFACAASDFARLCRGFRGFGRKPQKMLGGWGFSPQALCCPPLRPTPLSSEGSAAVAEPSLRSRCRRDCALDSILSSEREKRERESLFTPSFPVTYGGALTPRGKGPPCLHPSERKRESNCRGRTSARCRG